MTTLAQYNIAALALLLLVVGCSHTPPATVTEAPASDIRPQGALLGQAEVIRIAKQTAERQGVRLRDFKEPRVRYELSQNRTWFLLFDGKRPMPGNHFFVSVDDRTGEAVLIGGR